VRAAYAGLQQTHETFEEAAHNLGAGHTRTLLLIVIPLIGANIFGGALVSFVYSLSEASTTLVWINTLQDSTLTYLIYNYYALDVNLVYKHAAAALGIILILAQIIAISIANYILKKRGSALTGL
jgi:ABC-type Fe3+ transport system permease subunit